MKGQRGGFALGLIVGLLAGLAIALAVALYITKAPVPFIDKVPQRTAEQDSAEVERNKRWDPNAPLAGKQPPLPAAAASAPTAAPSAPPTAARTPASAPAAQGGSTRDPAAILAGQSTDRAAEAFVYFVQTGAFTRTEDAEQERARLAMLGFTAKVSEREQAGKTMYRVRTGPYGTRDDAEAVQGRLQAANIDARLVRAEKP
ncbi:MULTISPECIES: SPOR domain-containing protein [Rubrivivax]|uniref:SPOR domain-containing protein n=2 Tax=Rubrivivax benzoatilyticus TaxID=316997 RepID=A0ABX0HXU7_9BURK|nr:MULTISPECIES: SPOR domain-containing protein [Rubrivivax]MCD0423021.1 SPOR domain-containing protein [Rubrivivax sp. JA1024]MCC9596634.1 SPOR domain-containing protein [Rubrivivax sp. JA1055]MCC9648791.1 SPOR domain-containing protein [Rubrivivax sp. JA1029]NHK98629.1 SPOR domain-containing protein [Rubrivivax benzoatilyticus]NHL24131.1 SPOR domain-containing protein [Rubrivivax benzoatilyticus]